jgi:hypothetical protein
VGGGAKEAYVDLMPNRTLTILRSVDTFSLASTSLAASKEPAMAPRGNWVKETVNTDSVGGGTGGGG